MMQDRTLVFTAVLTLSALAGAAAIAGPWDPPPDYYTTATGTGATLKSNLHVIISRDYWVPGSTTHRVLNYTSQTPIAMAICGRQLDAPNGQYQVLTYTGLLHQKNWDSGLTWNREHTWPQSRGVGSNGPDFSDVHHLRSTDPGVNSSRSNLPFGTGGGEWDPNALGGIDRGETARSLFYMEVRYDGGEADTTNLLLVNGSPGGNQMGDLAELLPWHYVEGPDDRERRRNHLLFSNDPWDWEDTQINPEITVPGFERPPISYHQGNRNPFIDHPEFVWAIWGTGNNNSTLYVGGSAAGDGSSTTTANLGRAILGATVTGTVPLNKTGTHPTTWIVSTTGAANSVDEALARTYPYAVAPPAIPQPLVGVGIDTSLGTYGLQSGTVIVDNTDLTTAGPGQGSADADDVITVEAEAVDHSNGSFESASDVNAIIVDFGSVPQFSAEPPVGASLWNLASVNGATAHLDVDSVVGSGATGVVSINLGTSINLPAGQARNFNASVNTAGSLGFHQSVYTVTVSDENIPGAVTQAALTVTVRATLVPACSGDVNGDGQTNAADFTVLAGNFGGGPGLTRAQGDLSGDGFVNASDFTILAGDFGCQ
jgi:endonuclease I